MPRILVVSNRLPVTLYPDKQPPLDVKPSSGGLVSALLPVAKNYDELIWIGWPGAVINEDEVRRFESRLKEESTSFGVGLVPVWLTQSDVEDFYNGYSNASLWPLLHWMTPYARFKTSWAESYKRVNEKFADAVLAIATPTDLIWVHDYHLLLVPQLLRRKRDVQAMQDIFGAPSWQEALDGLNGSDEEEEDGGIRTSRPSHLPPEPSASSALETDPRRNRMLEEMRPPDLPTSDMDLESTESSPSRPVSTFLPLARSTASHSDDWTSPHEAERQEELDARVQRKSTNSMRGNDQTQLKRRVSIGELEWQNKLKIAFFLHTPFPPYEVLCVLPQCDKLIEGVLGADLVGFHTYGYLRHFRSCVVRACGFTPEIDRIDHQGQRTRLSVFPIGANCKGILEAMDCESFTKHLDDYTAQFQGKNLVLSVERLDYSKGMPQKLAAIQRYLEKVEQEKQERKRKGSASIDEEREDKEEGDDMLNNLKEKYQEKREKLSPDDEKTPQRIMSSFFTNGRNFGASLKQMFSGLPKDVEEQSPLDHEKTVFLFVAVPSRQEVLQYQAIEEEVHQTISRINGRFSTPMHQPLVYIHHPIPIDELAALYARADCCLVTPLIDGMNLVAKEFLAAKVRDRPNVVPGSLVLSELAGASQELFDAIIVNPYDEEHVAEAIFTCLELTKGDHLTEDQRWLLTQKMHEDVIRNDSVSWAERNLVALNTPLDSRLARPTESCVAVLRDSIASLFFETSPGTKALFLDYDGTLREFEEQRELAVPSHESHELFRNLDARSDLKVFIVSGRNKEFLQWHFKDYKSFTLIAEHGFMKLGPVTDHEWRPFNMHSSNDWIQKVKPIMDIFQKATPGAEVEAKTSAIVWHYRRCDEEFGQFKAKELAHYLSQSLGNLPCMISQGHCIVEVSSLQVKKGLVVMSECRSREAEGAPYTQVLCVGDDRTDESMFVDAPEGAYTVKVGEGDTYARWRLKTPQEVRRFLKLIVDQSLPTPEWRRTPSDRSKSSSRADGWMRNASGRYHSVVSNTEGLESEDGDDPLEMLGETEEADQPTA